MAFTNPGSGIWLYSVGLITALITAFYMTRMLVLVFIVPPAPVEHKHEKHSKGKNDAHDTHDSHEIHESPSVMTVPLLILALCSFAAGYVGMPHLFGGHENSRLFQNFVEKFTPAVMGHRELSEETEIIMMVVTTLLILTSMGIAYYIYVKNDHVKMRDSLKAKFHGLWTISSTKFKVDELYEAAIIKPLYQVGNFLVDVVETHIVNGIVNLVTKTVSKSGDLLDEIKPERLEVGILYIVIGLTVVVVKVFNAFIFR